MSIIKKIEERIKSLREVIVEEELDVVMNESSVKETISFMKDVIKNNKKVIYPSTFLENNGNIKIAYHNKNNETFSLQFLGDMQVKIFVSYKEFADIYNMNIYEAISFFNKFYDDFMND